MYVSKKTKFCFNQLHFPIALVVINTTSETIGLERISKSKGLIYKIKYNKNRIQNWRTLNLTANHYRHLNHVITIHNTTGLVNQPESTLFCKERLV